MTYQYPSVICCSQTSSHGCSPMHLDLDPRLPTLQVRVGPHEISKDSLTLLMCDFPFKLYFPTLRTFSSSTGTSGIFLATLWRLTMRSRCGHGPPSWILGVGILRPSFPMSTHGQKLSTVCLANINDPGSASSTFYYYFRNSNFETLFPIQPCPALYPSSCPITLAQAAWATPPR